MNCIRLEAVNKYFQKGQPNELHVLRDIDLELPSNQVTIIRGPSGSGKTTLLSVLGCLTRPGSGSYHCLGEPVSRWPEAFLTVFRRRHIGLIFQNFNLISGLNVAQNLATPLLVSDMSHREIQQRVAETAELVQIAHRLQAPVEKLSGGEMQRVAIGRALINQPQIIIADEPTAHLDSALAADILQLFGQLHRTGNSIIIATHDPQIISQLPVDQIFTMKDGRIYRHDSD